MIKVGDKVVHPVVTPELQERYMRSVNVNYEMRLLAGTVGTVVRLSKFRGHPTARIQTDKGMTWDWEIQDLKKFINKRLVRR